MRQINDYYINRKLQAVFNILVCYSHEAEQG